MNPDDIIKLLDQLAARMSGPAQHVWELAVRQQFLEGLTTTVLLISSIVIGTLLMYGARRAYVKNQDSDKHYKAEDLPWEIFPFCLGLFLVSITLFTNFTKVFTQLLNPEWAALQAIAAFLPK